MRRDRQLKTDLLAVISLAKIADMIWLNVAKRGGISCLGNVCKVEVTRIKIERAVLGGVNSQKYHIEPYDYMIQKVRREAAGRGKIRGNSNKCNRARVGRFVGILERPKVPDQAICRPSSEQK